MKTDNELQQDVITELKWEPSIDVADIGVSVKDGIVTLDGNVDTYAKKLAAERVAGRVYGVKAVAEEIKVILLGSSERTDVDIARAAVNALVWHMSVPHDRIKVIVQDGWVTLSGEVEWLYQKEAAEDAVRSLMGVRSVSNGISVKPTMQPVDIKDKIESALQRNALLNERRIRVETHGSTVILSGHVHSRAEKDEAKWAAFAAPGVSVVENNITINP